MRALANEVSRKEIEAMEELKEISELEWVLDSQISPQSVDLSQRKLRGTILHRSRPSTQQIKMKSLPIRQIMQTQNKELVYPNVLNAPSFDFRNFASLTSEHKKYLLKQPKLTQGQKQVHSQTNLKKQNYSSLRKKLEEDFFIGKWSSQKQEKSENSTTYAKKRKLRMGRPPFFFNLARLTKQNSKSYLWKNTSLEPLVQE